MWKFLFEFIKWAWRERSFLHAHFAKYFDREGPAPQFDGDKIKTMILEYEPIVWRVVNGGSSITSAVISVILAKVGPRRPTFEEEQEMMNRTGSPG